MPDSSLRLLATASVLLLASCDEKPKVAANPVTSAGAKPANKGDAPETKTKKGAGAASNKGDTPEAGKEGDGKKKDGKKEAADGEGKDAAPATGAAPSAASKKFRKGQRAMQGMTPEEVRGYAEAQGDPQKGVFTLDEALAGDDALVNKDGGKLMATFDTTKGKFDCTLFEDKAPKTVANFVGLARGVRESYDKKTDAWEAIKFYDGVVFHRVITGFMIQTGDRSGSGTGGPGYVVEDEFAKGLKHTGPGMLSMANRGKNTGSSQFFVTVAKTPHLDGKHAIFGKCEPIVPLTISKVKVDPRRGNRPYEPVKIKTITVFRKK